jgi:hypothetical protein
MIMYIHIAVFLQRKKRKNKTQSRVTYPANTQLYGDSAPPAQIGAKQQSAIAIGMYRRRRPRALAGVLHLFD